MCSSSERYIKSGREYLNLAFLVNWVLTLPSLSKTLDRIIDSFPKVTGGERYLSSVSSEALRKAEEYSSKMKDKFVSVEHILMGILDVNDQTARMLKDNGVNSERTISGCT